MSLEWIEGVPTDWKISESQFVLDYQSRDVQEGDEIVTAFRDGQVTLRSNRRTDGFTMADKEIGYQHICEGDLVVHSMDGGFGAIGVSDSCGKASPVVHAYTSTFCDLRFVSYQLRAAVDAGWIAALAKGIRVRSTQFDRPALASLKIAYPSIETQQRIADYLDRETAEIDAAVADLDRYVDLLEKRRTLRLVEETGIRGTSSMTMIGRHAQVALGKTLQSEQKNDNEQLVNYVRAGNIQPNGIFNGEEKQMWMTPDEQATYSILPDDVLVVEGGAGYGRSITFDHGLEGWGFQNHVIRIRPQSGWVGKFIDYSIRAHKADGLIDLLAVGATIPSFSSERVRNLPIAFLGESEQREVVHILDEEMDEIDSLISDSTKLRELLLKRRSVLITDVVTGRKQV
jgi:type I restriction enzyme S subunit